MKREIQANFAQLLHDKVVREQDETPRPAAVELLPEYGNLPEHMPTGTRIIIGKHKVKLVRVKKNDYNACCYRLRYQINLVGNAVYSVDDLNAMGAKLEM